MSDNTTEESGNGTLVACIVVGVVVFLFTMQINSIFAVIVAFVFAGVVRVAIMFSESSAQINVAQKKEATKIEIEKSKQLLLATKMQKQEIELAEAQAKAAKSYIFTSDDFDPSAQSILLPVVKESRKKGIPISGQGLINTILKSFR